MLKMQLYFEDAVYLTPREMEQKIPMSEFLSNTNNLVRSSRAGDDFITYGQPVNV